MATANKSNVAFLWDESFVWGIMAYRALEKCALPFDLIRAADISAGVLDHYKMLFVPGGWASNKRKALGEAGIEGIRRFVEAGGSYLGLCGGAGLATKARGCIGLLDVQRKPTGERVPSFSGRIEIDASDHPIWERVIQARGIRRQGSGRSQNVSCSALDSELIFHAWWPSQFIINDDTVKVLASFSGALPDAFSSDLPVGDVMENGNWDDLEERYQINLNPEKLVGEPAVVEGAYGRGKVVLSLLHFDTPDDINGQRVLVNLWNYLSEGGGERDSGPVVREIHESGEERNASRELFSLCADLIALGERNFLWFWRNSMLLQWRRGVRGLEYNTLYIMMKEIVEIMRNRNYTGIPDEASALGSIKENLRSFVEKAGNLLLLERLELQKGPITYIECDNQVIQGLRKDLFGSAKSHGGMFKETVDGIDRILYALLTNR